jgi:hypothetical protein
LTNCADADPQISSSSSRALDKKPHQRLTHEHDEPSLRLCAGWDWVGSLSIRPDVANTQRGLEDGVFIRLFYSLILVVFLSVQLMTGRGFGLMQPLSFSLVTQSTRHKSTAERANDYYQLG